MIGLFCIAGRTNYNNIQAVYSGGKMVSFSGVVIACGLFTDIMYETDRQRWLKRARYLGTGVMIYNSYKETFV